jgi:hypothetical protein
VTALLALSLTLFAPLVSAQAYTAYTEQQIEDWLIGEVAGATLDLGSATVSLDSEFDYMEVSGVTVNAFGISVGLSPIRLNFSDDAAQPSTDVDVTATFALFAISPEPRVQCTATVSCVGPSGTLEVSDVTDVKVGTFAPSLSAGDIDAIVDVINQVVVASGLSISPPDATLTGICVVNDGGTNKIRLTWSNSSTTFLETSYLQSKINGMIDTLEPKANNYLAAAEGERDWWIDVSIPGTVLNLDAGLTVFGVTASVTAGATFDDPLTATVTGTKIAVGSKTFTFSAEAEVGNTSPSITTAHFTLSPEDDPNWTGIAEYVNVTIQEKLIAALDDAFDDVVAFTGYSYPYAAISQVEVVAGEVRLHESGSIQVPLGLEQGWNLVSIPVTPADAAVEVVFPDARIVYTWNAGSYSEVVDGTAVVPGQGYWVAMEADDPDFYFQGAPLPAGQELALTAGWNMVGVSSTTAVGDLQSVEANTGQLLADYVYWWDPSGMTYGTPVAELVPGKGYWLACTEACTLIIS